MPVPYLNNVSTQDKYVDSLTVVFPNPRPGFSLNISNAGVFYQLLLPGPSNAPGDFVPEPGEHFLLPTLASFRDPSREGFPGMTNFAGIKLRSAASGQSAFVTVI